MDTVFINDLKIDTIIGIFEWEREVRQTVGIDIAIGCDTRKAAAADDIQYALDYKTVVDLVQQFVENNTFNLIESLAEQISNLIFKELKVSHLNITIRKLGTFENVASVGVKIERYSDDRM